MVLERNGGGRGADRIAPDAARQRQRSDQADRRQFSRAAGVCAERRSAGDRRGNFAGALAARPLSRASAAQRRGTGPVDSGDKNKVGTSARLDKMRRNPTTRDLPRG